MAQEKAAKQSTSRVKPFLMIVAFVVTLFLLVGGIMTLSDWNRIRPYKALANELNETLGGSYTITNVTSCEVFDPSCPRVNLDQENIQLTLEQAKSRLSTIADFLKSKSYVEDVFQGCIQNNDIISQCGLRATSEKTGTAVSVGVSKSFISISIYKKK